ncbi:Protein arginine N-methyltransferase 7 [Aphelenchoides bicaudatus]|nr:Protein arginine N-methyltransferase 7 [Aphelenchoides bicaudatus]
MLTDDENEVFESISAGKLICLDNYRSETDKALDKIRNGDVRINCLDKSGMNYLDQAAFKGNEKLAEELIKMGADADNRKHSHGYTSLMFAALAGKPHLCEMLLNAGARSYALNNMNKNASEMAAFVGHFECASLINSYIGYEDVNVLVHPKGEQSETIYPKEFVEYIHKLTRTHLIHPVSITKGLLNESSALEHRKKLIFIVDRLFEKQLRCKQPNEILSLKMWIILTSLREISNFIESKSKQQEESPDLPSILKQLIKQTTDWKNVDGKIYRQKLETFLTSVVFGFPYKHSIVYTALARSMKNLDFGRAPNTFTLICSTLFGQRYAQAAFCSYCGQANASKCCSNCKVVYCSADCQKSDWSSHKKVCEKLKADPTLNAYLVPGPDDSMTSLTLSDKDENADASLVEKESQEQTE